MDNMQVPNGGMLMVTAPAAQPAVATQGGAQMDPRLWRPRVTKDNTKYEALLRALPRGRDLNAYPYVCIQIHRFRDPVSGLTRVFKCCKNVPGQRNCPYCEDVWGRYGAAKEQPGATKDSLKVYLQQLPEEEWYGNFLIRQDANHPELNGQVKVWPHSKYQHAAFQDPVDKLIEQQTKAAQGNAGNGINVDTGDAFVPYDPSSGYDYHLVGVWDPEKSFGNGRKKGAPTYKGSAFLKNPTPLFTKTVVDPTTNQPVAMFDEESTLAILDQCYDLNFVFADIPTPQQAIEDLQKFWAEANEIAQGKARSANRGGYGVSQAPAMGAAPAMAPAMNPSYAAQPFQTGAYAGAQNAIPQVPSNAKITTNGNAAAFMGQAPAAPAPAPAAPVQAQVLPTNAPAPMPVQQTPATPAFAPTPAQMMAPVPPAAPAAPAAPAVNPGFPAMGIPAQPAGFPQATPAGFPQAAPAAPAAPAQQAYVPPAAPPLNTGVQVGMPGVPTAGPAPIVETDSDDDLPFSGAI